MSVRGDGDGMDNVTAIRLKNRLAQEFRDQLTVGVPTSADDGFNKKFSQLVPGKLVAGKVSGSAGGVSVQATVKGGVATGGGT